MVAKCRDKMRLDDKLLNLESLFRELLENSFHVNYLNYWFRKFFRELLELLLWCGLWLRPCVRAPLSLSLGLPARFIRTLAVPLRLYCLRALRCSTGYRNMRQRPRAWDLIWRRRDGPDGGDEQSKPNPIQSSESRCRTGQGHACCTYFYTPTCVLFSSQAHR
jgi:hypothetical protein